ncbi:phytanoyl-CoA dioxygenase [Niabella ginsenosidivorans]|uniref:Phytanoyl-CoA dioxygenase n=1 Tax=Niabella ginsenosidivorans TaxID=1176587 RepID=A0A1A9HZ11_9BACT|nr:phytanoyl-CoA dioxygenase family protein [Niabella ginsenosidivorans]ANH80616.1 phytanoyl-CoA dioxygenase [Niabella ginsenosidivorans]
MSQPTQPFYFPDAIKPVHIHHLKEHGILHFKQFITPEAVQEFIAEVKSVEKYLLNKSISSVNGIPLKFGTDVDGSPLIQRIAFASQYSAALYNFLKSDRVQQIVNLLRPFEGRIGATEKDGLVVNHYLNTQDSGFTRLGWHTDSPRDLFLGSRIKPMLNVGLHLDDCPQSNGGLRVLAGTHNKGLLTLFFKKKYFIDHKPDEKEIGFDIEAGDLTVHDGRLWHRVQQSPHIGESSRRRVMYIPVVTGAYAPKHADSKTPIYHQLARFTNWRPKQRTIAQNEPGLTPSL